jgi:biopolymer transport protein ExbD
VRPWNAVRDQYALGAMDSTTVRVSPTWRKRGRSNELICYINVTGFLSVIFLLLIAYVVQPVSFLGQHGPVDMAKVSHPIPMSHADRENAIQISVTREGKVFFGSNLVRLSDLPSKIRGSVSRGSEKKVYIRADARAKYAWVAEVLDSVHDAGIEKIGFLVDQRKTLPFNGP